MPATLKEVVFNWNFTPATPEQIGSADGILTQSWSRRADGKPGRGNVELARIAAQMWKQNHAPIIPQEEVSWVLKERNIPCAFVAGGSSDGRSTLAWDTWAVAKAHVGYCREMRIRRPILVAHPLHMNRALWSYRRLGLDVLPAPVSWELEKYQDPGLVHPGMQSMEVLPRWILREKIIRLGYWGFGRV
ncbi:MAG: hypothetical protein V4481_02670 [Patescibacteria group bacterium]